MLDLDKKKQIIAMINWNHFLKYSNEQQRTVEMGFIIIRYEYKALVD